ncbi:MAG: DegV family protein [Oscillospiraceae bacterium]|jgi:DegV family protein with EDD domain|nr:DegV family protein [Oscillospiraceae bacterium]
MSVVISADSTADLTPELLDRLNVRVSHNPIIRGSEQLLDGVDIQPDGVFEYYEQTGRLVKTCAPNAEEYLAFLKPALQNGDEVIHFTISSEMSASYAAARSLTDDIPNLYIVDSRNLSTGIALLVMLAVGLRDKGLSAKAIMEEINAAAKKVDASFIIDTLEYLHKGGRCSGLAALGANLLRLKPCIEVRGGKMTVGKKYRGKLADVHREYIAEHLRNPEDIDTTRIFITHSGCPDELLENAKSEVSKLVKFDEVLVTRAGCSISVHCGRNTLGILFIRKSDII